MIEFVKRVVNETIEKYKNYINVDKENLKALAYTDFILCLSSRTMPFWFWRAMLLRNVGGAKSMSKYKVERLCCQRFPSIFELLSVLIFKSKTGSTFS